MNLVELWRGWRYYRIDAQPWSDGWRIWYYRVQYDGWHHAVHLGPIIISWGDGLPPQHIHAEKDKT